MILRSSPGVFKWGHVFQRGDLPIYIMDAVGSPFSPFKVTYTILFQPKLHNTDGQHRQDHLTKIWPCDRIPVQADIGEYYGTGCAGEGGQPGQWFVEWTIQEYLDGPLQADRFGFEVFNTAEFCPRHHHLGHEHERREHEWLENQWGWDRDRDCRCGGRRRL